MHDFSTKMFLMLYSKAVFIYYQKVQTKLNYPEHENSFKGEIKSTFTHSFTKNCVRPESAFLSSCTQN